MHPTSLWLTWERTVSVDPTAPAVIDARDGRELTRGELTARTTEATGRAPAARAGGQVVAFGETNSAFWLVKFLALQRLGAVALPLDTALPVAQRANAAEALGARWLWDEESSWHALNADTATLPGDVCLLKTTSGSTGQPRALPFTSANMLADGRQIAVTMGIGPEDRNLGAIPFGHSYGLGNLVMPLVAQGTAIIASTEILPDALAAQIERFRATVLPSVPAVLRGLAESAADRERLKTLRQVVSAGAPLRGDVATVFLKRFGLPIQNFYGSSETGGICFDRTGEATASGRSVGVPLEGVVVRLDEGGRITVRSDAVAAPGEHTLADLGAWNPQGELVLTGRATALANIGGKKVAPSEIERVLRELEGVTDAWVGVRARASGGEDFLLAAVETERTREDVQATLARRLPAWQVPRRLWVTARLPRTERGKLDRRELEAHCTREPAAGAG